MQWTRRAIAILTVAALSLSPANSDAQDFGYEDYDGVSGYDMGSGDGFYDEGVGFEAGFDYPSKLKLLTGVLAGAFLLALMVSSTNGNSGDGNTGGH